MPDVFEGNVIPDPSQQPDSEGPTGDEEGRRHGVVGRPVSADTAFAEDETGQDTDGDGIDDDIAAPGSGEGTGVGGHSTSSGTP